MVTAAHRVVGDQDLQDNFRVAMAELREAAGRLQSQRQEKHAGRAILLLIGVAVGVLFNPFTGPDTRRWLKDKLFGGSDEFGFDDPPQTGNGGIGAT